MILSTFEVRSIFPFLFQSGPSRTLVGKLDAHEVQAVSSASLPGFSPRISMYEYLR